MHLDHDQLALLALDNEELPGDARIHLATCNRCQRDYAELYEVVTLAREADDVRDLPSPPERVWDAIAREISPDRRATVALQRSPIRPAGPALPPHRRLRRAALALAAVVVVAVAAIAGFALSRTAAPQSRVVAVAALSGLPAAPPTAHGQAQLVRLDGTVQLRVTLAGMPQPRGYYEAWLFDPATGTMYPMGPLTAAGGTLSVAGVDLSRYTGVDISAQPIDDSGGHGQSMLRGSLD